MDEIIKEQELVKNGIVDKEQAVAMGKLLGARLLLIPEILQNEEFNENDPRYNTNIPLLIKANTA
jgi:hypothetical protein